MSEIDTIHFAQQAALEYTRTIGVANVDMYIEEYKKVFQAVYDKISGIEDNRSARAFVEYKKTK